MNLFPPTLRPAGRLSVWLALVAVTLLGASCRHPLPKYVAEFYLEAPGDSGIAFQTPLTKQPFRRVTDPFLTQRSITRVEQGKVSVSVGEGLAREANCLIFFFDNDGQQRLYMASAGNLTKRIFLFVNGEPIAVRYIDQPISDGSLFVFPEVPDKELPAYVTDLKESQKRFKDLKNNP